MSDSDDTQELISSLPHDGFPEPQIGPQNFPNFMQIPEMTPSGDQLGTSVAVSDDSLEIQDLEVNADEMRETNERPESARSNRVIYQPTGDARQTPPSLNRQEAAAENVTLESEDISDLIQPLGSENTGRWMNSVLDRILPDLKSSLDAEYGRERDEMESEHKSRLQTLHAQHHHAQFELYEKNVKAHEQIQKLEEELEAKNKMIANLSHSALKEKEKPILARALFHWRLMLQQRKVEQKMAKLMREINHRHVLRSVFNEWHNLIKEKWKTKVEKVCKERATEICIKLKDELTGEINRLTQEVKNRDQHIQSIEAKQNNYEENLTKALMRGVCALNMEAMSVIHSGESDGISLPVNHPTGSEGNVPMASVRTHPAPSRSNAPPASIRRPSRHETQNVAPLAPNNSLAHIPNPSGTPSNPASNVFLNTVNSLEDFSSRKKLSIRNSVEFNGAMATGTNNLCAQNSKGVLIERHFGAKVVRTKSPQKPRQGSEPWRPVGRLTTREQKRPKTPAVKQHVFSSVKHVD